MHEDWTVAGEAAHDLGEAVTVARAEGPFLDDAAGLGEGPVDRRSAVAADEPPVLLVGLDDVLVSGDVELRGCGGPSLVGEAEDVLVPAPAADRVLVDVGGARAEGAPALWDALAWPGAACDFHG